MLFIATHLRMRSADAVRRPTRLPSRISVQYPSRRGDPVRKGQIVREFSVPASFTVGEHDTVAASVFSHAADDPDHVIIQRLVDGAWTDVTCAQVADQVRATARGLIAEGVQAGDRVAILSATR